jgi:hypothetical protein
LAPTSQNKMHAFRILSLASRKFLRFRYVLKNSWQWNIGKTQLKLTPTPTQCGGAEHEPNMEVPPAENIEHVNLLYYN